jgi:hypothetical protein
LCRPKVAGDTASLQDQALDRILDFAAEAGLVVLLHNDIDVPFAKAGSEPAYFDQVKALFKRHQNTTIIWAHIGVGRIIRPVKDQGALIEQILKDPSFNHVHFDISWDEVAKYAVATPESTKTVADFINQYPDRFLFGTDEVAPPDQQKYTRVYYQYEPLWKSLEQQRERKSPEGKLRAPLQYREDQGQNVGGVSRACSRRPMTPGQPHGERIALSCSVEGRRLENGRSTISVSEWIFRKAPGSITMRFAHSWEKGGWERFTSPRIWTFVDEWRSRSCDQMSPMMKGDCSVSSAKHMPPQP